MTPNWPEEIKHEIWCPASLGRKCACDAGEINDMRDACIKSYEDSPKPIELRPLNDTLKLMSQFGYSKEERELIAIFYRHLGTQEGKK